MAVHSGGWLGLAYGWKFCYVLRCMDLRTDVHVHRGNRNVQCGGCISIVYILGILT